MLIQRVAVAAVGLPLLALLLVVPEPVFSGALEVILAVAAYEFVRAALPDRDHVVAVGAAAVVALLAATLRTTEAIPVSAFLIPTAAALFLALRPGNVFGESRLGWWLTGVLYVGVLGAHVILLRDRAEGIEWLIVMLAATFSTDTGAYAVGRLIGRRPFAPRISPKKTWEGAIGGLAIGAVGAGVAMLILDPEIRRGGQVLIAVALPIAAITGDLLESAIKRRLGVKDMSNILPGHGGFLDRLDSILLTGPVLYWIVRWLQT
jgi:phosphatidate cytidylyltransferase